MEIMELSHFIAPLDLMLMLSLASSKRNLCEIFQLTVVVNP